LLPATKPAQPIEPRAGQYQRRHTEAAAKRRRILRCHSTRPHGPGIWPLTSRKPGLPELLSNTQRHTTTPRDTSRLGSRLKGTRLQEARQQ
jgi:hypothetical protein